MLDKQKFLNHVSEQFVAPDNLSINEDTDFKQLESFDSLTAMAIIATIEDEYKVKITDDELLSATSINDLFYLTQQKQ